MADDPVATLLDVDVGDEVTLAAEHYEWGSPFAVIGVDEVRFRTPSDEWRARELELRSAHPSGADYEFTIVEGCDPPRVSRGHGRLEEATTAEESADGSAELTCDNCGNEYENRTKLNDHKRHTLCGAQLPDDMDAEAFADVAADCNTILELDQEFRDLNRSQLKHLLEEHDLYQELQQRSAATQANAADDGGNQPGRSNSAPSRDELIEALDEADTVAEVADCLDVGASTALYHIGKHGLEDRIRNTTRAEEVTQS
jgi:hypothetical protein